MNEFTPVPLLYPVPVHGNDDLKIGLQRAIMKLAGISEEDLSG